jgi:chromosome segregation ATPase
MADPTNPFQNRNELKDYYAEIKRAEEAEKDRDDYQRTANDYYRDNIRLRAELAAERERTTKKDERIDELMGKCVVYAAKQAKLREALEDAAIALDGWDDDMARRIRAVLEETKGEEK